MFAKVVRLDNLDGDDERYEGDDVTAELVAGLGERPDGERLTLLAIRPAGGDEAHLAVGGGAGRS